MSDQSRINKMLDRLKHGLDRKLQFGVQPEALACLNAAYTLARQPTPLDPPWPEITAYRLAHLKMRNGAAADWSEVDKLLKEASARDILGPAPLVYRLIALWKRHSEVIPSQELEVLYERARDVLAKTRSGDKQLRRHVGDGRPLQPDWFNLLELVVYATGLPYEPITGWNDANKDHFAGLGFESSAWMVLEEGSQMEVQYPEFIAREHFKERCQQLADCIASEFVESRASTICRRQGDERQPGVIRERQCHDLLSLITKSKDHLGAGPESAAMDPSAEIRQRKRRLRRSLSNLAPDLVADDFTTWWDDPRTETRPAVLPPIIMLVKAKKQQRPRR